MFLHSEIIKKISISGNLFFSEKQIKKIMISKEGRIFNRINFKEDKENIENFYKSQGFLDIQLKNYKFTIKDNYVYINIKVEEGFKTVINEIKIFGNEVVDDNEILKILSIKKNMPLSNAYLSLKQVEIQNYYASLGYIYANIDYELYDKENKYRKILYVNITENKPAYIKNIILDFLPKNTQSVAFNEIKWQKGELYIPAKIYGFQQQLYSSGVFSYVAFKAEGIENRSDSIDIVFSGKERKKHYVGGGLLYQFPDRGKIILSWGNDNVFNNGEKLSLETSYLMNLETDSWFNSNIVFIIPYAFNNLFSYNFKGVFERTKNDYYKILSFSATTGISKKVKMFIISNSYKYKISMIDTNVETNSIRFLNASTNSSITKVYYDSRNNPFYPLNGIFYSLQVEYAGGIFGGYNNFYKYLAEFVYYKTQMQRITNGFRIKTGFIIPFGSSLTEGISIDEQFTLGGYSSIRGIQTDSLGPVNELGTHSGNMFVNLNFESRMLVYKILGISYFFDSGLLYNNVKNIEVKDFVLCGGFGVFIKTPVGPIRIDLAKPMNYNGNVKFYINIGNSF